MRISAPAKGDGEKTGSLAVAEILTIDAKFPEGSRIARAAQLLRQGQVIAIPTDTFYGLAADPFNLAAVEKVFAIKGRPKGQPLLLLVDSVEMAAELAAVLPGRFYELARRFWPGPLTIVVRASSKIPSLVTGKTGKIGLRLPAAPIASALIQAAGRPVTATSANRSGQKESSSAEEVNRALGDQLPLILDGGASRAAKPSTLLELSPQSWRLLREGAIPKAEIAAAFRQFDSPAGGRV